MGSVPDCGNTVYPSRPMRGREYRAASRRHAANRASKKLRGLSPSKARTAKRGDFQLRIGPLASSHPLQYIDDSFQAGRAGLPHIAPSRADAEQARISRKVFDRWPLPPNRCSHGARHSSVFARDLGKPWPIIWPPSPGSARWPTCLAGTPVLIRGDVDAKPGLKIGEGDIRLRSMAGTLRVRPRPRLEANHLRPHRPQARAIALGRRQATVGTARDRRPAGDRLVRRIDVERSRSGARSNRRRCAGRGAPVGKYPALRRRARALEGKARRSAPTGRTAGQAGQSIRRKDRHRLRQRGPLGGQSRRVEHGRAGGHAPRGARCLRGRAI